MQRAVFITLFALLTGCDAPAPTPAPAPAPPPEQRPAPPERAAAAREARRSLGSAIVRSAKRAPRAETTQEAGDAMVDKQARRLAERAAEALRAKGEAVDGVRFARLAEALRPRARREIYALLRLKLLGARAGHSNTTVAVAIGSLDEAFEKTKLDPAGLSDGDLKAYLDRAALAVKVAKQRKGQDG